VVIATALTISVFIGLTLLTLCVSNLLDLINLDKYRSRLSYHNWHNLMSSMPGYDPCVHHIPIEDRLHDHLHLNDLADLHLHHLRY